ncbi:MAG: YceD family protein [Burkholderiales bacterium]|nr:YceD family protein [Burkholderiales bacterium]
MTVPTIDTHEFTRRGDVAEGRVPLAELERLGSLLVADDGELVWRLAGDSELGADGSRRAHLHLALSATLAMRCVRCLERIDIPLDVERDYRLVATEAQAEQEDVDEDEVDLLVGARRFDLAGLVEDEAIMALPPAPRHDGCSAPAAAAVDVDSVQSEAAAPSPRNPFAALGALRDGAEQRGGDASADPSDEPAPADPAAPRRG